MTSLMTRKEVAEYLNVSVQWLELNAKQGPPSYRLSPQVVRYKKEDLDAWLKARKVA